jgi:hypothetical protein
VGKGKGKRAWSHLSRKDKHHLTHKLQKMLREGHDPQPEFLCKDVDEEFAYIVEKETIAKYGRQDLNKGSLLNLTDGGEGNANVKYTSERRLKISQSLQNRSPEVRKKISEKLKGIPRSQEVRKKISEARMGMKFSADTCKKISESKKGNCKGVARSLDTKTKISESKLGIIKPKFACMLHNRKEYSKANFTQNFPYLV